MVVHTLLHLGVESSDLLLQETALNHSQVTCNEVVRAQQLVKLVNMAHVLLVLQGNTRDGVRNGESNSVQELGLTNDDPQLGVEVDLVLGGSTLSQDVLVKIRHGVSGLLVLPHRVLVGLVVVSQLLGKLHILLGDGFTGLPLSKHAFLGLELLDGSLDSLDDASGPNNGS